MCQVVCIKKLRKKREVKKKERDCLIDQMIFHLTQLRRQSQSTQEKP